MKETTVSASVGSRAKRIGPGDESPNKLHSSAIAALCPISSRNSKGRGKNMVD